jgi:hypothetical protein
MGRPPLRYFRFLKCISGIAVDLPKHMRITVRDEEGIILDGDCLPLEAMNWLWSASRPIVLQTGTPNRQQALITLSNSYTVCLTYGVDN